MYTNESPLKPGMVVEVRSAAEILATLDTRGVCHGIIFMPEMQQHVGKQYRVAQLALKVCGPKGNVHLPAGTVYLERIRCDGSAHGGCQAACRVFWREEWLRPAQPGAVQKDDDTDHDQLAQLIGHNVSVGSTVASEPKTWRCQATQIQSEGTLISWKEPGQYVCEVTSGNVAPLHFVRVMTRITLRLVGQKLKLIDELPVKPAGVNRKDGETLQLQPNEWVEVRSPEEIALTLNDAAKHRGLTFTDEMAQHCGKRFRVRQRIDRIIEESTGRMLEFKKNACITLEGVVCSGDRATAVWFCRRDLYPYWREAWLKRVEPPAK